MEVVRTDDVQPGWLGGAIVFSVGCHAGLAVPDDYVPGGDSNSASTSSARIGPRGKTVEREGQEDEERDAMG